MGFDELTVDAETTRSLITNPESKRTHGVAKVMLVIRKDQRALLTETVRLFPSINRPYQPNGCMCRPNRIDRGIEKVRVSTLVEHSNA